MCVYMGPKFVIPSSASATSLGTKRRGCNAKQPRIMVLAPAPVVELTVGPMPLTIPTGESTHTSRCRNANINASLGY